MDDLASHAMCSNSTIRDFEAGRRAPHRNRLAAIRQALEVAGIVFSESGDKAGIAGPVKAVAMPVPEREPKTKPPGQRKPRSGGSRRKARRSA